MTNTNTWRGKTIYRKCSCGETAHDARSVNGTKAGGFVYACRNCGTVARHRAPRKVEATPIVEDYRHAIHQSTTLKSLERRAAWKRRAEAIYSSMTEAARKQLAEDFNG